MHTNVALKEELVTVRKAIIPSAGLGTRFLPATKSQPKEMIPVIDKPAIQYAVEEAVRAGLTDIVIVTSRGKHTLEDHFDRSLELEAQLEASGKTEQLEEIRHIADLADIYYVRQKEPLGFGHAVAVARAHIGDEPFAVLVGDEIVPEPQGAEKSLMARMLEIFEAEQASVIAVQEVPREAISSYGVISPGEISGGVTKLRDIVEKPAADVAPSNLAARGRYVFTPEIFDAIDSTSKGVGDEVQLTDAIRSVAAGAGVFAYIHEGPIFDVGKKLEYLQASVQLALRRNDLAEPLRSWLQAFVAEL